MPASEKLLALNASTATDINPNVGMFLHPDNLLGHGAICVDAEYAGPSIDGYAGGRAALKALYDSAAAITTAHRDALRPEPIIGAQYAKGSKPLMKLQIPAAVAPELASAMASSASRAAANVERHLAAIDKGIDKLNNFIVQKTSHPKPNEASVVAEASEIRAYVKNLKDEARMGFLLDSARAKDSSVIFSVLSASPFVSGLNREQHQLLRDHAIDSFAPTEAAQRKALVDIKEKVKTAMGEYAVLYAKHLPRVVVDPSSKSMAALKGVA